MAVARSWEPRSQPRSGSPSVCCPELRQGCLLNVLYVPSSQALFAGQLLPAPAGGDMQQETTPVKDRELSSLPCGMAIDTLWACLLHDQVSCLEPRSVTRQVDLIAGLWFVSLPFSPFSHCCGGEEVGTHM